MRLIDYFLKRKVTTPIEREKRLDLSTKFVLAILHCDEYDPLMDTLRKEMNAMTNLMPDIPNETPAQRKIRQDSLIALAVNQIHEDPELGPRIIIEDEDARHSFIMVTQQLQAMNENVQATQWSKIATKSDSYKDKGPSAEHA